MLKHADDEEQRSRRKRPAPSGLRLKAAKDFVAPPQRATSTQSSSRLALAAFRRNQTHRNSFNRPLHGWISKENPENEIEMVVYREAKQSGQSKIVNHKMPFGKEIWGNCKAL